MGGRVTEGGAATLDAAYLPVQVVISTGNSLVIPIADLVQG